MIKVTAQQRANAIEARDVMWPSVPEENVFSYLSEWNSGHDDAPNCNTHACFGGWCAWWPNFRQQGVRVGGLGEPSMEGTYLASVVSQRLFGCGDLFVIRGEFYGDHRHGSATDHELVTRRLTWLIKNSEVVDATPEGTV